MGPFLGSLKQKSDRIVHRAFFRLLACVLITVLGVGLPAKASAQSANDIKPNSAQNRQLLADPGRSEIRSSVKLTPDQPPNSYVQYGDVWGCHDGFTKLGSKCISIFSKIGGPPENSYVQYRTIWGCTAGFRKEGSKCVTVFTKKKVRLKTED